MTATAQLYHAPHVFRFQCDLLPTLLTFSNALSGRLSICELAGFVGSEFPTFVGLAMTHFAVWADVAVLWCKANGVVMLGSVALFCVIVCIIVWNFCIIFSFVCLVLFVAHLPPWQSPRQLWWLCFYGGIDEIVTDQYCRWLIMLGMLWLLIDEEWSKVFQWSVCYCWFCLPFSNEWIIFTCCFDCTQCECKTCFCWSA